MLHYQNQTPLRSSGPWGWTTRRRARRGGGGRARHPPTPSTWRATPPLPPSRGACRARR
uniref:Protein kinase CK2 regulatory subunit CK2B3 n=1 Tax=Arundo donax TaxID=35708 RepID=A0A0A9EM94_ARUDO